MLFPHHAAAFWLCLTLPYLVGLVLYILVTWNKISLKPLRPWFIGAACVSSVLYLVTGFEHDKLLSVALGSTWNVCLFIGLWIQRRYMFETLRASESKWSYPWRSAQFSVPGDTRVLVRDVDSVSPWYVDKLGLRKLTENPSAEMGAATFRFKKDGRSIILTTRADFRTGKTPIFFTKKLGKIKEILNTRGVDTGSIEKDRQGIRYFEIYDPEGNAIEVVEEP